MSSAYLGSLTTNVEAIEFTRILLQCGEENGDIGISWSRDFMTTNVEAIEFTRI